MGLISRAGQRRLFQQRGAHQLLNEFSEEYGVSLEEADKLYNRVDQDTLDANLPAPSDRIFGSGKILQRISDFISFLGTPEGQAKLANWITAIKTIMAAFGGMAPITQPKIAPAA